MAAAPPELWLAIVVSGLYHGVSPGMGWPLAVAAALFNRRASGLLKAMLAIGTGHLIAIGLVLLPFAALEWLVERNAEIRIGAGLLVMGFGMFLLIRPRHPRALARIRPDQLILWGFVIAVAHGAGLMLVPIYLGIAGHDHFAHTDTVSYELLTLTGVSIVHTAAMVVSGGFLAWLVYRHLGLQFLRKSWFNLEMLWALSLVLIGAAGAFFALDESGKLSSIPLNTAMS